ncbi:MAG: cupin domain-containing protein [Archaeoglobus sp.]|uniref:cupin domain-containing protein n=1 Tax=Archaeoglobus sp. TaxID=1872626 RepID=UPI001DA57B0E|nr:cupin domain-containing protein [Archaeoglobus sp.]MBO8180887.1 cupin domain-containing protein [Archaeoglobus sp.]
MKKVCIDDVKPYEAPGHFNMVALRLHHKETTGSENFWMGLSHFLPGGGAEWDKSDIEKVYFVLSGKITVVKENGEKIVLEPMDSLYIPAGEPRYLINETNMPASMLVIASYPKE